MIGNLLKEDFHVLQFTNDRPTNLFGIYFFVVMGQKISKTGDFGKGIGEGGI